MHNLICKFFVQQPHPLDKIPLPAPNSNHHKQSNTGYSTLSNMSKIAAVPGALRFSRELIFSLKSMQESSDGYKFEKKLQRVITL